MARLSRALGLPLTPKAEKYFERRPYPPGEHGRARRRNDSDYSVRLKEKQRLRAQYALREKQMHRAYLDARKESGLTGESMIELLEMRLDALVLRSGIARTIAQARQDVVHRHILVDGKVVDRPSYRVKPGQTIQVRPRSQVMVPFQVAAAGAHRPAPALAPRGRPGERANRTAAERYSFRRPARSVPRRRGACPDASRTPPGVRGTPR